MIKNIQTLLGASMALIVTWNVHPFLGFGMTCLLAYALVDSIISNGGGDDDTR